ncbi:hypothetical protein [Emcibacter sp. SYSU 3D8]|uniref:hypothetical protein n=1 Tax=Emcibacter sp. SYSU 3D8 TaxID=3133969 RepID=UPI0031FEA9E0
MRTIAFIAAGLIAGCGPSEQIDVVTLYRNSPLANDLRIHWATFDAAEGADYNLGSCEMAAKILNANLEASAKAEGKQPFPNVGFWCEPGGYSESGGVPTKFDGQFPSDTTSSMRFSK